MTHTLVRGHSLMGRYYFYLPFCVKSKLSLKSVIKKVKNVAQGGGDQNRAKKVSRIFWLAPNWSTFGMESGCCNCLQDEINNGSGTFWVYVSKVTMPMCYQMFFPLFLILNNAKMRSSLFRDVKETSIWMKISLLSKHWNLFSSPQNSDGWMKQTVK